MLCCSSQAIFFCDDLYSGSHDGDGNKKPQLDMSFLRVLLTDPSCRGFLIGSVTLPKWGR